MVGSVTRRRLLKALAALPLARALFPAVARATAPASSRVRPSDPGWPSESEWEALRQEVGGGLVRLHSPFEACTTGADDACATLFKSLKNPYFIGDDPALTQTLGWVGAWTSRPSVYAVEAKTAADVAAAVNFARRHNLRLVVKGGGHSYLGQSNAPDSLLIWTRPMQDVTLHDAFVAEGCAGKAAPQPAVSVGAGAIWGRVYDAVTTKGGRYVQGGGCLTVGVAGLVSGGGFGSWSKAYGVAAASLLEAEVVTADGGVKIASACSNPDLFWALKGGGGGFGVITRLTLKTHDLPSYLGAVFTVIKAGSDDAWRRLVAKIVDFYAEALFNPHWGEQIGFRAGGVLIVSMTFGGLDQGEAEAIWRPFLDWVAASPKDFHTVAKPMIIAAPAGQFWNPAVLKSLPGLVLSDDRPGAPPGNIFWAANRGECGQVLHSYQSVWMPAGLLETDRRASLVDALVAAAAHWGVTLHANKGLAGAARETREAALDTALNPSVAGAFALAITGAEEGPAYPGLPGHEPDEAKAAEQRAKVSAAMGAMRAIAPGSGSYLWEADYFEPDWQTSFWGTNYARLLAIKRQYDPDGLFFLHHGVGSEDWSEDGFVRAN